MATVTTHNHDFERQRELLISEIAEVRFVACIGEIVE